MVSKLHKILKPFLLRRTKAEADASLPPKKEVHLFVGLTETQINIYRSMLSGRTVNDDKKFYVNLLMQLRKVCNHPYLFDGIEEEGLPELGSHLINNCGKMIILDKLLEKLTKEKRQTLIFSQMTRMLDILEDYCNFRGYQVLSPPLFSLTLACSTAELTETLKWTVEIARLKSLWILTLRS